MPSPDYPGLKNYAQALPGSTFDIKFDVDCHVYSIEKKMFVIFTPEGVSFKVADDDFLALSGLPGALPAPYLARAKWIQVKTTEAFSNEELRVRIKESWRLVLMKLPKKTRERFLLPAQNMK